MANTETLKLTNYLVDSKTGDYYTPGIYEPGTLPDRIAAKAVAVDTPVPKDPSKVTTTEDSLVQKNPLQTKILEATPAQKVADLNPDTSKQLKVGTKNVKKED